jgi:ferrous iron transport protein A
MEKTLADLGIGNHAKVVGYDKGTTIYRRKLLAMGLTRGTDLTVNRVAPLGDPIEITVRGFQLSLRRDEAVALLVEEVRQ